VLVLMSERDTTATQVVGRYFDGDAVSGQYSNAEPSHLSGDRAKDGVSIFQ